MSISALKNTIVYQMYGRPLSIRRDMASVPVGKLAVAIDRFKQEMSAGEHGSMIPEDNAIWFYLGNHAMREIAAVYAPNEPLPPEVLELCEDYHRRSASAAARAMYYLAVITAREARHCQNKSVVAPAISDKYGKACAGAMTAYQDTGNIENATSVFKNVLAGASLTAFAQSVRDIHALGSFSGGYGGKKWAVVTDCLVSFVTGQYTAEMMLDTVWTLAHNGGPIFNKGMLYGMYDQQALQEILDIQRAGQIPRLVFSKQNTQARKHVKPEMVEFAKKVQLRVPGSKDFSGDPLDWDQIKVLGALGNYTKYGAGTTVNVKPVTPPFPGPTWTTPVSKPVAPSKSMMMITPKTGLEIHPSPRKKSA